MIYLPCNIKVVNIDMVIINLYLKEVKQFRIKLANHYPCILTHDINVKATTLYEKSQNNIGVIMMPSNPGTGALGCYNEPENCVSIATQILSQVQPINDNDLPDMKNISRFVKMNGAPWWPTGENDQFCAGIHGYNGILKFDSTQMNVNFDIQYPTKEIKVWGELTGAVNYTNYNGPVKSSTGGYGDYHADAPLNPFVFSVYNNQTELTIKDDIGKDFK